MIWLLAACATTGLPQRTITVGGHTITVEVAATDEARAYGLKNRDSLPPDTGMLFVYDDEKPRSYWMEDTHLDLSIAFVDRTGHIVRITDMIAYDTNNRGQSLYPAKYAVEMAKGWFTTKGVVVGDAITGLPASTAEAAP